MPDGTMPAISDGNLIQQITSLADDTSYAAEDRLGRGTISWSARMVISESVQIDDVLVAAALG